MMEEPKLTERDYELLSAYLDDMLDAGERSALEERLRQEPDLQAELNALRNVIALVKQLPIRQAPRNFTLTAGMVTPLDTPKPSQKVIGFPLSSALSAAAAFIFIALGLILATGDSSQPTSTAMDNIEAPAVMQAQATNPAMNTLTAEAKLTEALDDADMGALDVPAAEDSNMPGEAPTSLPTMTIQPNDGADEAIDMESEDIAEVQMFEQEESAEELSDDYIPPTDAPIAMSVVVPTQDVQQPPNSGSVGNGSGGANEPDARAFVAPPSPASTVVESQEQAQRDAPVVPGGSALPTATVDLTVVADATEIAAVVDLTLEEGEASLDGTVHSEDGVPEAETELQTREISREAETENQTLPFVFIGLGIALFGLAGYLWWDNRQVAP